MAEHSKIEWTDATWNIITGCTLVDEGCRHCYAAHLITSWPAIGNHPSRKGLARKNAAGESKFTGEVRFNEQWLDEPLRWKKPRKIFVCAHGDLFHENVPDEWIDKVFAVMALAPQHTFQVLTKRPERARAYLSGGSVRRIVGIYADRLEARAKGEVRTIDAFDIACDKVGLVQEFPDADIVPRLLDRGLKAGWPLPNVWLGTSISDQASADLRIPHLLACPAAVRFISAEPLLGPVDLRRLTKQVGGHQEWMDALTGETVFSQTGCVVSETAPLDWIICGGESGPHARPMHPDWARSLRDQCAAAGVAFLFKQVGEWTAWEEAGSIPYWRNSFTGAEEDHHILFPRDWDNAPNWDDGLNYLDQGRHVAFNRVGKARAGRLLDGVEHNGFPRVM